MFTKLKKTYVGLKHCLGSKCIFEKPPKSMKMYLFLFPGNLHVIAVTF